MIWAACKEMGVKPPGVKDTWDECDVLTQARLIAFHQTAEHDRAQMARAGIPRIS